MRSRRKAAAATAVAIATLLAFAAHAFGLPPFSTAAKTSSGSGGQAQLSGIDAGCHATFDRFVVRVGSGNPGYDVRYVNRVVADPSGKTVALQGSKRIRVVIRPARGHTAAGTNLLPSTLTPLCSNLRQIKKA